MSDKSMIVIKAVDETIITHKYDIVCWCYHAELNLYQINFYNNSVVLIKPENMTEVIEWSSKVSNLVNDKTKIFINNSVGGIPAKIFKDNTKKTIIIELIQYVNDTRRKTFQMEIESSGDTTFEEHYNAIENEVLSYFKERLI